jgi:hypothetical protein
MTESSGVTLRQLLPEEVDMKPVVKDELRKNAYVGRLSLAWGFIGSEATDAVRNVLDCDVFEIVARGWCVARELHEYADSSKHPPGERSIVHLGEHEFATNVHPVLSISVGAIECPPLRFTLELAAHFRSVALSISNGRITGLAAGDGYVSAQLKYGTVNLHKKKESEKVPLPVEFRFREPGLAIG